MLQAAIPRQPRVAPTIPLSVPNAISCFINSTYDAYCAERARLHLRLLINYYVLMRQANSLEARYLLGCVFLEALKYAFAIEEKYEKKGHSFYDTSGAILRFEDLVKRVYGKYGINNGDTAVFSRRNTIIHEGYLSFTPIEQLQGATDLERTIKHLLLKILKYDGPYVNEETGKTDEFKNIKV